MSVLDTLVKLLGPQRAVSVYVFLQRWGIGIGVAVAFAALVAIILISSSSSHLRHLSYETLPVTGSVPLNNDPGAGMIYDVLLPNGTTHRLTETEGAISAAITDSVCVETRVNTETYEATYRLRRPYRCAK